MARIIYSRTAIYFAAFVVTVCIGVSYARTWGLSEDYVPVVILVMVLSSAAEYIEALGKTIRFEKNILSIDYEFED
jgi:hypothetical protein